MHAPARALRRQLLEVGAQKLPPGETGLWFLPAQPLSSSQGIQGAFHNPSLLSVTSGPGLWLTLAPTQQTEFLELPFYIRTSVSFLMWQHLHGRAQLPPLRHCLPPLCPLSSRLHPASPGKPGRREGGRQGRDTVRWWVGGQEGRQQNHQETLWVLLFLSQLPLHLSYSVMEKMGHGKKLPKVAQM